MFGKKTQRHWIFSFLFMVLIVMNQNCGGKFTSITDGISDGAGIFNPTPTPTPNPSATPGPTPTPDQTVPTPTPDNTVPSPTPTPVVIPPMPVAGYPLLFVTSVPTAGFATQLSTFSNHNTGRDELIAGGDLYIRYPDGTLRNLTREAGYGVASGGIQGGPNAIAVRQPSVFWDGTKALFSMVIGGATQRYEVASRNWQIYEVSGLAKGQTVHITKVPNQPSAYNNISPIYGSDDSILFTSDAPLFGMTHTYPQLDEYESATANTGIWKLDPRTGVVTHIQHASSGSFDLFLDSFGRIIFTGWDHLKRDQQADADRSGGANGSFDFASEAVNAVKLISPQQDSNGNYIADTRGTLYDQFPEARAVVDRSRRPNENLHDFNQFTPWQINEDGGDAETVNHLGNDEILRYYKEKVFNDDPNLSNVLPNFAANTMMFSSDSGFFQLKEDINRPGYYLGVYAKEFGREASGRVIEIKMDPSVNPEDMVLKDYTNDTLDNDPNGLQPRLPSMTGHYRNPLRLSDGSIVVSHTNEYRVNQQDGTGTISRPRYVFQLKQLVNNPNGSDMIASTSLTGGLVKDIRWWKDDAVPWQYNGPLSEVDTVEVRPRQRPVTKRMTAATVEKTVMQEEAVDEAQFRNWLKSKNLAVIVSRNVTMRDRADITQPFNLRVPGGVQNIPTTGKVYDIANLQVFQADLTRAYEARNSVGRRVYAKPLHNSPSHSNIETFLPQAKGMAKIAPDGSMATVVPAGRAVTWQLTSPDGTPVVRERYWLTFAPGEVRTCTACHGINKVTHNGLPEPTTKPQAFRDLLRLWKNNWVHTNP